MVTKTETKPRRPLLGAHMSIAGGVGNALLLGAKVQCDAIQIFTKSSRQWAGKPYTQEEIIQYRQNQKTTGIKKVIAQMESEDGWVDLGEVGKRLTNLAPDFDSRTFGSRKLSDLVRKTNSFEIDQPKGGSMRIRIKPPAGSPPKTRAARKSSPVPAAKSV